MKLFRKCFILFVVALVISTTAFGCRQKPKSLSNAAPITLKVWGIFDTESDLSALFRSYKKVRPNVTIEYRSIALKDYEKILLHALSEGNGPDIFLMHNRSLPKYINKIAPLPQDKFSRDQFDTTFVSVAKEDLIYEGEIYGLPLYVDSLGLIWNYDHFRATDTGRPKESWKDFIKQTQELVERQETFIDRAHIAFGTTDNVHQAADILLALFLQKGAQIYNSDQTSSVIGGRKSVEALEFYTSFSDPSEDHYTWNLSREDELDEFLEGNVSVIVGYSYLIDQVIVQARPKGITPKTAKFPQFDTKRPVYFADYWAYTVSQTDDERTIRYAWDLLIHMIGKEQAMQYFETTHRPPSRRDLVLEYRDDVTYGPFVAQAPYAKTVTLYDREVYNDALEKAIDDVYDGVSASRALKEANQTINAVVELYVGD